MSTNQIPSLVNGSVQSSYTNYMPQQNDFGYYTSSQTVNTSYFGTSSNFSVVVQDYKTSAYRSCETYTGVPYYHGYVNRHISTDISNENSNYVKESAVCSGRKRSRSRSLEKKKVDLFDLALSNLSADSKSSDSSMEEGADKEKEKINLKKQKLNQIRQKWRKRHQARNQEKNSETKKQSFDGNESKQSDSEKDNSSEKVKKSDTYQRKPERSQDQSRPSSRNGNQITESRYKDSSPPLPLRRFPIHNRYPRYGVVDSNTLRRFKYDTRDSSPPRRSHDFRDSSPSRRYRYESPHRYRYDGPNLSPSYHTRYDSADSSPSRRVNHDSSCSPIRRTRHDTSSSPVRRSRYDTSSSPVRRPRHDTSSSPVRHPRHDTSSSPTRSLRQDTTDSNTTQYLDDGSNAASPSKRTRHDTPTPTRDELPSDQSKCSSSSDVDGKEQDKSGGLYSHRHHSRRQVSNKYRSSRKKRNSHSHRSRSRSRSQDRHHSKYGNNESTVEDGELKSSEESSFSDTNFLNYSAKGCRKYKDRTRDKSLTPEKGHMNQKQLLDTSISPTSLVIVSESDTSLISSPQTTGSPVKILSSSPVEISSKTVKKLCHNKQGLPNPTDENPETLNISTNLENPSINEAKFTPKSDSSDSLRILELEKQNLEFQKKIIELKIELDAKNKALETFELDSDAKIENLNETYSEEVEVLKEEITFLKRDNDREREFTAKSKTKEKDLLNRIGRLEDGLLHSGKENLELREKLKKLEEELDSLRYKKYQVNYSSTSTSRNYYDFPTN